MKSAPKKEKVVVIVGPTASSKSDIAVSLAQKYKGEIVSADSRQMYKRLNIATGKITREEMKGIPHYLLDIAEPEEPISVADYKIKADNAIDKILKSGKIPFLVGGTGFYVQAVVDRLVLPEVPPNQDLRKVLSKKSPSELFKILYALDPRRAKSIDAHNLVRLIRAIEIAKSLGSVPDLRRDSSNKEFLLLGLEPEPEEVKDRIHNRTLVRLKRGMIAEAERLYRDGLSYKRMDELGLEYKILAKFLKKEIGRDELIKQIDSEDWQYAKRQMTWFKKDNRIKWFHPMNVEEIGSELEKFLRS